MAVRVRQRTDRWYVIIDHNANRKKKAFPDKETAVRFARTVRERLAEGSFGLDREEAVQPCSTFRMPWDTIALHSPCKSMDTSNPLETRVR